MKPLAKVATPAAIRLLKDATEVFPKRSRKSDGLLPSAAHVKQNPDSDHNDGYAVDLTNDKANGCDCEKFFYTFREDPRVEYLIFKGRIWRRGKGEARYVGPNQHEHHLHVSLRRDGKAAFDTRPWFPGVKPTRLGVVKATLQKPKKKKP